MYPTQRIDLLKIKRGDSFEACFRITDELDLPRCQIRAQVRRYPSDFRVLLELDVETDTDEDGQFLMLSKPAAAMRLEAGNHVYDVQIEEEYGDTFTSHEGKFQVIQDVTK